MQPHKLQQLQGSELLSAGSCICRLYLLPFFRLWLHVSPLHLVFISPSVMPTCLCHLLFIAIDLSHSYSSISYIYEPSLSRAAYVSIYDPHIFSCIPVLQILLPSPSPSSFMPESYSICTSILSHPFPVPLSTSQSHSNSMTLVHLHIYLYIACISAPVHPSFIYYSMHFIPKHPLRGGRIGRKNHYITTGLFGNSHENGTCTNNLNNYPELGQYLKLPSS